MDQFFLSQTIVHVMKQLLLGLDFPNLTSKGSKNGNLGIFFDFIALLGVYRLQEGLQISKSERKYFSGTVLASFCLFFDKLSKIFFIRRKLAYYLVANFWPV